MIVLSIGEKRAKLKDLSLDFGFTSVENMLEAASVDSVSPAICARLSCGYTADMEPDQREGHCEICSDNTVQSALVLAGLL